VSVTEDIVRTWDGNADMTACTSAADYRSICAGHTSGDLSLRSSWKLPHHQTPGGPPDPDGVRNALGRLPQTQGLTDAAGARAHLERHMRAINPDYQPQRSESETVSEIVRGLAALDVEPATDGALARLTGYMARFDEWATIRSFTEGGPFVERIARGSFADAFGRDRFQPLYDHGHDPSIGRKPLGEVTRTGEDQVGAFYEVALFDTDYTRALLPGLEAGVYGSSFRADVVTDVTRFGEESDYNPDGLDEHVVRSVASLKDFGPTPFAVYGKTSATAARSMTDEYLFGQLSHGEGLEAFSEYVKRSRPIEVSSTANTTTPVVVTSTTTNPNPVDEDKPPEDKPQTQTRSEGDPMQTEEGYQRPEEVATRKTEVLARQKEIAEEFPAGGAPEAIRAEWDGLKSELQDLERREAEIAEFRSTVERNASDPAKVERAVVPFQAPRAATRDIFDPVARRSEARSEEDESRLKVEDASRAIEGASFPNNVHDDRTRASVERANRRGIDEGASHGMAEIILATGSPAYRRAFAKVARGSMLLTAQEQYALERAAFTLGTTGMPVVWTLDPTVIRTSNYVINPLRAISRVETITGTNEWRGVTSGAVVAARSAEANEASDNTPTLTQPAVKVERVQAFVPFSREVDQDWGAVQTEMAGLFAEAKDIEEATAFLTGNGTTPNPEGILGGGAGALTTTQRVQHGTTGVFAEADLLALQNALPPRARSGMSVFLSSLTHYNRIRALDTSGGNALWVQLQDGLPPYLLGMRAYELSTMTATLTGAGNKTMLVGDFSKGFLIVDRIGMEVELIPHLFGATNRYPTGQRGLWAMWRNSCKTLDPNRFRYLETI